MTLDETIKLRLQFISRVANRECHHLNNTAERLFALPFTLETTRKLDSDAQLSEQVEAFSASFARFQDTLGDKFIPQLLIALGEKKQSFVDNLDTAERLGWIASVDEWLTSRQLRNQMVHDYIEDLEMLTSAIQSAYQFVSVLTEVNTRLQQELQRRGWQQDSLDQA